MMIDTLSRIRGVEGEVNKFDQISGIFSQFSEENKDKLLETAKNLLKVQMNGSTAVTTTSQGDVKAEGRCPEK
jgi:hypothetical protein